MAIKSAFVRGTGENIFKTIDEVPVELDGKILKGQELLAELRLLAESGCMEPSLPASLERAFLSRGGEGDEDTIYVVLGATSELGPLKTLLALGRTVLAVSRPGTAKWKKLCKYARGTRGTLVAPVLGAASDIEVSDANENEAFSKMGADLFAAPATLASWILDFASARDKKLKTKTRVVVGTYVYLDSEKHVRATMATDFINKTVCEARPGTVLSFLGSPATVHSIPSEAHQDSLDAYHGQHLKYRKWWHTTASAILGLGGYSQNAREPIERRGSKVYVFNGLLVEQGPNYALAKHLQMWRCLIAHAEGHIVTTAMTPPATTVSVMHSKTMAVAMNGLDAFPPMRKFSPEFVSPLMAIVAVALLDAKSSKTTTTPYQSSIDHPFQIFEESAFHGGNWRLGYRQRDLGPAIYIAGLLS